jgi:hypothetical protein
MVNSWLDAADYHWRCSGGGVWRCNSMSDLPEDLVHRVAMEWWRQYREAGPGVPSFDRISDLAVTLFESVFTIDLAIDSFAQEAKDSTELAMIGTHFLEEAAKAIGGRTVLAILSDSDVSASDAEIIRSGINPALIG